MSSAAKFFVGRHPATTSVSFLAGSMFTGEQAGSKQARNSPSSSCSLALSSLSLRVPIPIPPTIHQRALLALPVAAADLIALYGTVQDYPSVLTLFIVWSVVLGVSD